MVNDLDTTTIIAAEIAEDLEAALTQFAEIAASLSHRRAAEINGESS